MNLDPMPAELQQLVAAELNEGVYESPADALIAGMRLLREQREKEAWLKAEIQIGLDQRARGECLEFDDESLDEYFEQLKRRGRERLQEEGLPTE